VIVMKPEDLLVERVLVSVYPEPNPVARYCAKKLVAVALGGAMDMDWSEVRRVANLPEYKNVSDCAALVQEVANELKIKNPLNPN